MWRYTLYIKPCKGGYRIPNPVRHSWSCVQRKTHNLNEEKILNIKKLLIYLRNREKKNQVKWKSVHSTELCQEQAGAGEGPVVCGDSGLCQRSTEPSVAWKWEPRWGLLGAPGPPRGPEGWKGEAGPGCTVCREFKNNTVRQRWSGFIILMRPAILKVRDKILLLHKSFFGQVLNNTVVTVES